MHVHKRMRVDLDIGTQSTHGFIVTLNCIASLHHMTLCVMGQPLNLGHAAIERLSDSDTPSVSPMQRGLQG